MDIYRKILPSLLISLSVSCASTDETSDPGDMMKMSGDTTAPTFAGIAAAEKAPSSVMLSWQPASDDHTAADQIVYLIYQATASGGENFGVPSYVTQPGATHYSVLELAPNTRYFFVVRARDEAGNVDTNASEVSVKLGDVTLSGDVQPILQASCAGCHSGARPAGRLDLSTPEASYKGLVQVASGQCPSNVRVVPNQPDQSYLIWKLDGMGPCYKGVRMPKEKAPLATVLEDIIKEWIAAGAPNN